MTNKENKNEESDTHQQEEKRRHIQERLDDLGVTPGATTTTEEKAHFPTKLVLVSVLIIGASIFAYIIGKNQASDTASNTTNQASPYPAMQHRSMPPGPYAVPGRPLQSRGMQESAPAVAGDSEANTETEAAQRERMMQQRMRMQQRRAMYAPHPQWQRPPLNAEMPEGSEESSSQAAAQERAQQYPAYRPYSAWRRPPAYEPPTRPEWNNPNYQENAQYPAWRRPPMYQRPPAPYWQRPLPQESQAEAETENDQEQAMQQGNIMPPQYRNPYAYPRGYPWGYYPYPPR